MLQKSILKNFISSKQKNNCRRLIKVWSEIYERDFVTITEIADNLKAAGDETKEVVQPLCWVFAN